MISARLKPSPGLTGANLALAAIYFAGGKFGLSLAFVHASATAIWPPTGIALAALLLFGYRLWPGVYLGALLVSLATLGSVPASLVIAGGNTIEALAGAFLVNRYAGGVNAFERTASFLHFVLLAGFASTALSPTIGVTSLCATGAGAWERFGPIWLTWWLGDIVSNLTLAPLLLVWARRPFPNLNPRQILEAAALLGALLLAGQVLFLGKAASSHHPYPLTYLALPPLLWAAFRFNERGAVTANLLMAALALWGTLHNRGPFAGPDPHAALLHLQAFVGTVSLSSLALASAVSERIRSRQALEASQARLHLQAVALQSAANAILITNREGRIEWVNNAFTRLTGYPASEALGHNPRFLKSGQHPPAFFRGMWNTVLSGKVWHGEVVNKRRDGTLYTEEMTITPVLNGGGADTHFIAIKQDVTGRRMAEDALRQAKERLARTNATLESLVNERTADLRDMVSELEHFSYSIVHDMRAPLRAIQSFSAIIEEELGSAVPPRPAEYLARMRTAAHRMDQLITDALAFSHAVRTELKLRPVDIGQLLRGILDSYPGFDPSRADISLQGEFPPVMANEAGLTQCFSNLLNNAVKFTRPGQKPKIRIWAECCSNSALRIWVEDNGIGIPEGTHERIFGMFQRVHGSAYEGTGIGLALVRKVVERMNGRVGVESMPGNGSRFWVELKAAEEAEKA